MIVTFPSPCGDYGSSDLAPAVQATPAVTPVSVPLRGLRVFGPVVPGSGRMPDGKFPSPCGDYGSSDRVTCGMCSLIVKSFRPLAGITGLRTRGPRAYRGRDPLVSVPLRGLRVFGRTGQGVCTSVTS